MKYFGAIWQSLMVLALRELTGQELNESDIITNKSPDIKNGDIAFPIFSYAARAKQKPVELAEAVARYLTDMLSRADTDRHKQDGVRQQHFSKNLTTQIEKLTSDEVAEPSLYKIAAIGPYVNVFLDRAHASAMLIEETIKQGTEYGASDVCAGQRIMIEFSAPNTNKPLHLGHLRNDALGESVSRLLLRAGAAVRKVNLVNDRGVHICKSMLAYKRACESIAENNIATTEDKLTPESENIKSDHFVGKYYVAYDSWERAWIDEHGEDARAHEDSPISQASKMLRLWEKGDQEVRSIWRKMNAWAIAGLQETYARTGITFDKVYLESETYLHGRDVILQGQKDGVFSTREDGAVVADLSEIGLDSKVLLRADGTSVYITQDIGTARFRYEEWNYDEMIYVVAHEQNYHFKVLFYVLGLLGFAPAVQDKMVHLGYGMVHLPDGRMKSREGTVVDADTLLDSISDMVKAEVRVRDRGYEEVEVDEIAQKIALGAVHYYLLAVNPKKDITFNPKESIQFQGNTGPYLQYTCARISSMLDKFDLPDAKCSWDAMCSDEEWKLVAQLDMFPSIVEQAALKQDPSLLAHFLYELSSNFSSMYQNLPIAQAESEGLVRARMRLSCAVQQVLKNGLDLLNIPFIAKM